MSLLRRLGLNRLMWPRKLAILRNYGVDPRSRPGLRYLLTDPEIDNFTYELANEDELVAFGAENGNADLREIRQWIAETREDPEFTSRLARRLRRRPDRNTHAHFGRRLGWYALARGLKPSLIVETGIHDGLGSLLLLRALDRNAAEGRPASCCLSTSTRLPAGSSRRSCGGAGSRSTGRPSMSSSHRAAAGRSGC